MNSRTFKSLAAFSILNIAGTSLLHAETDCAALLQPDITVLSTRDDARLAYLYTQTKDSYEKHQQDLSLGALIPVDAVPIDLSLGWRDFQSRRASESTSTNFTFNRDQSMWYYANRIPPERSRDFVTCAQAAGRGLTVELAEFSDKGAKVLLLVQWRPGPPVSSAKVTYKVINGTIEDADKTGVKIETIPAQGARFLRVNRVLGKDLVITATTPTGLAVAWKDPAPPVFKKLAINIGAVAGQLYNGVQCEALFYSGGSDDKLGAVLRNIGYNISFTGAIGPSVWNTYGVPNGSTAPSSHSESGPSPQVQRIKVWDQEFSIDADGRLTSINTLASGAHLRGYAHCPPSPRCTNPVEANQGC